MTDVGAALRTLALRDVSVLLVTVAVWWLDASLRVGGGAAAGLVGVAAGVLAAVCAFLAHEWGHLAGALAGGAVVHPSKTPVSLFLFRFDTARNGRDEFLRMSWGGFAASAAVLVLLAALLPLGALSGRVALALAALGVVATFALEVPVAWRVARGEPLPTGAVYTSADSGG